MKEQSGIYELNGRVPLPQAVPLGLQHVMTMFVNNVSPVLIISGLVGMALDQRALIIQNAMFVAGIVTLLQVFRVWRFGAKLPVVMGTSAGFLPSLTAASAYGYGAVLGACALGGLFETVLGFFIKPLKRLFPPIVTGTIMIAIGLSLMPTGIKYMAGGEGNEGFGSVRNLVVGIGVLVLIVILKQFGKGFVSQAAILIGMLIGCVAAGALGMLDFSSVGDVPWFSLPRFMPVAFEFHAGAILPLMIMFIVTAVETVGDISGITMGGLDREATDEELSGGVLTDGIGSFFAALFGVLPNTSMSQNVGLVCMTRVVNRFVVAIGAGFLVLAGFFPKLGAVVSAIPPCVLGGATILAFSMIAISGMQMVFKQKMDGRNGVIVALALGLGTGLSAVPAALAGMPYPVQLLFSQSGIVVAFLIAVSLNLLLPQDRPVAKSRSEFSATAPAGKPHAGQVA